MASFLVTFSNLRILWNLPEPVSLQSFSSVDCLDQVLQRDYVDSMESNTFHGDFMEKLSWRVSSNLILQVFSMKISRLYIVRPKIRGTLYVFTHQI